MAYSYIYLRDNEWFQMKSLIKLGVTSYLINRESGYKTSEPVLGEYIQVYQIPKTLEKWVDKKLKQYFKPQNIILYNRHNAPGGSEYYTRDIIDTLNTALRSLNVKYKRLTFDEIVNQERKEYFKEKVDKNLHFQHFVKNPMGFIKKLRQRRRKRFSPRPHQQSVLDTIQDFYQDNDIGKIIWACGLGKALLSIQIVEVLKFTRVLIGVPSEYLQMQFQKEILKMFPNPENICLVNGQNVKKNLDVFLSRQVADPLFVITTYHSCHHLLDIPFHFKIGDECHHLVGDDPKKHGFRLFHKIQSNKTLFMTATEKTSDKGYSMDDTEVFGELIDEKCVKWAIENKHITDYQIVCLKSTKEELEHVLIQLKPTNPALFTSTYMCLKSLSLYSTLTHILLYTNTIEESNLANEYIRQLLETPEFEYLNGMYHKSLHSKSKEDIDVETKEFRASHCGIICCAYIFGEGVDLPELNGVCVACNMQSEIRIVQYLLRPNRKHNEGKIAYIIIPYTDDEWSRVPDGKVVNGRIVCNETRIQSIVWQMRNLDESVEQKIFVSELKSRKPDLEDPEKKQKESLPNTEFVLSENTQELQRIKVRLRYSRALHSDFTEEEDEYIYLKVLNEELKLGSKMEYIDSKSIHPNYINDAEAYFRKKGVWTNWYDFLGTDTSEFIESKQEWIDYCKYLKISSIEHYKKVAETDRRLPKDPGMFYREFGNIPSELGLKSGRR